MELNYILFYILSAFAVVSALLTILLKHPLKSAIALIFHFFILSGIYLTLSAQFLAMMQIIVYAGAIMVLVLFVIMLLNQDKELFKKRQHLRNLIVVVCAGILLVLVSLFITFESADDLTLKISANSGTVQNLSEELYTNFLVPIEITGILLLSAIIGAILLAKKRLT